MKRYQIALWSTRMLLLVAILDLGGSLYEHLVVDMVWPHNMLVIQPENGGINRKLFWIPIHAALTLLYVASAWSAWKVRPARWLLLGSFGLYLAMRVWTFLYFVPLALTFETATDITPAMVSQAQQWVRLSLLRAPVVIAMTMMIWKALAALQHGSELVERSKS